MSFKLIKGLHFWIGLIGVFVFILTGQYMHHEYNHLKDMPDGARMLFRSGHIYFLLAAVINFVMGVYMIRAHARVSQVFQMLVSTLFLLSLFFLLLGFFTEPHMDELLRPYSRIGLYAIFGGVVLLFMQSIFDKKV